MVNHFTINLGFYMLMPYLAPHLSGTLGLAGWIVGLVLGVRNFSDSGQGVLAQWRGILANRPFLLFSVAMIGSYVLSFQVCLALPLEVRRLDGDGEFGTAAVAVLFAVSEPSTILGRTRVTAWCKARYEPGQALVRGPAVMGLAFVPLLVATAVPVPESGIGPWLLAAVPPTLAALYGLHRTGRLTAPPAAEPLPATA